MEGGNSQVAEISSLINLILLRVTALQKEEPKKFIGGTITKKNTFLKIDLAETVMNPKITTLLGVVLIAALLSGCTRQSPDTTPEDTANPDYTEDCITITTIKERGGRVDWSHALNVVAFDKRGDDNYYDVYIMNPDGSDEYCFTCNTELPDHHNGNPAWHPSGEWIVFQSVNTALIPSMDLKKVNQFTNPGAGWLNNVWVADRTGEKFYQLTDVGNQGGVLHPHFSHDGKKLFWAQRIGGTPGSSAEDWVLKVADFVTENEPVLENIKTFYTGEQPHFSESHGFSLDGTRILFSGNLKKGQPFEGMDVYELDLQTEELIPLTETFYDWDEHASYSPDGKKIVWMSSTGYDTDPLRADFWIMDADGSNKQQLTFFNSPGHPHYMGDPIVGSDSSWSSDGKKIIAYIKTESTGVGSEGSIIMIEFLKPCYRFWQSLGFALVVILNAVILRVFIFVCERFG